VRTLLGAAIGLGGGAIVNATLGARFANEGGTSPRDIGGGVAIGAGIGAIRAVATRSSTRRRPQ